LFPWKELIFSRSEACVIW